MPKLTYAEHPVHPVLNDYPAALVPTSLVFDMLHLVTRRRSFKVASFFTMLLALLTGGAAAATGYADYREIPPNTEAKRIANAHAMLNVGVLASLVLQLLIRSTGRIGLFARLLNVAANVGLVSAGWYGTHLVYRHGTRVDVVPTAVAGGEERVDGRPLADALGSALTMVPDGDLSGLVTRVTGSVQQVADTLADRSADATEEWSDDLPEPEPRGALGDPVADRDVDVTGQVNEALADEAVR